MIDVTKLVFVGIDTLPQECEIVVAEVAGHTPAQIGGKYESYNEFAIVKYDDGEWIDVKSGEVYDRVVSWANANIAYHIQVRAIYDSSDDIVEDCYYAEGDYESFSDDLQGMLKPFVYGDKACYTICVERV